MANDSNPDGGPFTAQLGTTTSNGVLTLNANGSFTYTPNAGFNAIDSFTYRAFDGTDFSNLVTVTINVDHRPVAAADGLQRAGRRAAFDFGGRGSAGQRLGRRRRPDDGGAAGWPTHGTVDLATNGSFLYTPAENYAGNDSFTYRTFDGDQFSDPATVTITLAGQNDPPTAAWTTATLYSRTSR